MSPFTIACVTELWIAAERRSSSRFVIAGGLLGLGILTDLFSLALLPAFVAVGSAVVWWDRGRAGPSVCSPPAPSA